MEGSSKSPEDFIRVRKCMGDLFQQVGEFLGDLCAGPEVWDETQVTIDKQLGRHFQLYHALKQRHENSSMAVAVLALTKSGKSTFINSLAGEELLPMNNVPETARICRVIHDPDASEPFLMEPGPSQHQGSSSTPKAKNDIWDEKEGIITARGGKAVRARLQELNRQMRASREQAAAADELMSGPSSTGHLDGFGLSSPGTNVTPRGRTEPSDRRILTIHARIAALREYDFQGSDYKGVNPVQLHLLDTPGPNEAGELGLRHQVERLLGEVDAAVYLLDYTKLKTEEEASMFERLKQINPALVSRLSQRLFIVVNKADAFLTNDGQDEDATREYVADLVTRQMKCEGFQLTPDQVFVLSARNALLSRRILLEGWPKDPASAPDPSVLESRARFAQLAFGRFASLSTVSTEAAMVAAHALLEESAVPELESQVLAYLYSHAGALKQLALVDDLRRLISEVRNVSASSAAVLAASAESLEARAKSLREELTSTLQAFDHVNAHADAIASGVVGEVRAHLQTLRGRLFSRIITALDTSGPPSSATSSLSSSWQRIRERFLSIFTSSRSYAPPGAAKDDQAVLAAAGGAVARSRSKVELTNLLAQLNTDITKEIHAEVSEFWSMLEVVASARHAELLEVLNKHLRMLSLKVENAVSCSFNVELEPVKLTLAPMGSDKFHCSLEQLIAAGLVESKEHHIRVAQREDADRVVRYGGGICRWGDYWEEVPRVRTVVERYTTNIFELAPYEISKVFINMVDSAIRATDTSLEAYVSRFVRNQLKEARDSLEQYSEGYLGAMRRALELGQQGAEQRLHAYNKVKSMLGRLDSLVQELNTIQGIVEAHVPNCQSPVVACDDILEMEDGEVKSFMPVDLMQWDSEELSVEELDAGSREEGAGAPELKHEPLGGAQSGGLPDGDGKEEPREEAGSKASLCDEAGGDELRDEAGRDGSLDEANGYEVLEEVMDFEPFDVGRDNGSNGGSVEDVPKYALFDEAEQTRREEELLKAEQALEAEKAAMEEELRRAEQARRDESIQEQLLWEEQKREQARREQERREQEQREEERREEERRQQRLLEARLEEEAAKERERVERERRERERREEEEKERVRREEEAREAVRVQEAEEAQKAEQVRRAEETRKAEEAKKVELFQRAMKLQQEKRLRQQAARASTGLPPTEQNLNQHLDALADVPLEALEGEADASGVRRGHVSRIISLMQKEARHVGTQSESGFGLNRARGTTSPCLVSPERRMAGATSPMILSPGGQARGGTSPLPMSPEQAKMRESTPDLRKDRPAGLASWWRSDSLRADRPDFSRSTTGNGVLSPSPALSESGFSSAKVAPAKDTLRSASLNGSSDAVRYLRKGNPKEDASLRSLGAMTQSMDDAGKYFKRSGTTGRDSASAAELSRSKERLQSEGFKHASDGIGYPAYGDSEGEEGEDWSVLEEQPEGRRE